MSIQSRVNSKESGLGNAISWKRKPSFFIVGAPKCGTTAMNAYLKEHPEIFVPEKKEFHYFGSDLSFKNDWTEEAYRSCFEQWEEELVGGESSVWYLHSKMAAKEIYEFNPNAKIIIMLRNPTEMVYAQHSQAVYVGRETLTSFSDALDAEKDRREGKLKTHPLSPPEVFNYSEIARYTEQIKRYVDLFGKNSVHFVIFDDLKADAEREFKRVLSFLGVSNTFLPDLSPRNKNRQFKNKWLHFMVNNPHPAVRFVAKKCIPSSFLKWAKLKLQRANTSTKPRGEMDSNSKSRLQEIYRGEVELLSEYLGRDLRYWST